MNLYEDSPQTTSQQPMSTLIEIDLSRQQTLMELVNLVRNRIEPLPSDSELTIYFVCGRELKCNDVNLFIDYLQTIENPLSIIIRGYVHFDFIKLLFSFPSTTVNSNLKLIYSKVKLHDALVQMLSNKEIVQKFMTNFISSYHKLEEGSLLDISDLTSCGIKLNQF